ncbi:MAG: hypothetical protein Q8O67_20145 [Deltaproteobacteria bacterium]|nr:hypothetical protein [Deltaproteobacteria bacterium]
MKRLKKLAIVVVVASVMACVSFNRSLRNPPLPRCGADQQLTAFTWPTEPVDVAAELVDGAPLAGETAAFSASRLAVLQLGIGVDGFPACVEVHRSSGDLVFDRAAEWGLAQTRWTPGQRGGRAVDSVRHWTAKAIKTTEADACLVERDVNFCSDHGSDVEAAGDHATARQLFGVGCDRGDEWNCRQRSRMLLWGRGGAIDFKGARDAVDGLCRAGKKDACFARGQVAEHELDWKRARADYLQACELRSAQGCASAAWAVRLGFGGAASPNEALTLSRRACELGNTGACNSLAFTLRNGSSGVVATADARLLAEKACRRSDGRDCNQLAYLLLETDRPRALALFEKGCTSTSAAALNLCDSGAEVDVEHRPRWVAEMWKHIHEAKDDDVDAARYALRAAVFSSPEDGTPFEARVAAMCMGRELPGFCDDLGIWRIARGDVDGARLPLAHACEHRSGEACAALANITPDRRPALLRDGCLFGDDTACDAVVVEGIDASGLDLRIRRSCEIARGASCRALGLAEATNASETAPARAAAFFRSACAAGDALSCRLLAKAYRSGQGVGTSTTKAEELEDRAATLEAPTP